MAKRQSQPKSIGAKDTFDTFWVMINLNGPRYWKISNGVIEKSSAPADFQGPVLSFDDTADFRVRFDKSSSVANARKYFLTEKQEKCRAVAGLKKGIYYGTPIGRIDQFEHKLYPGSFYIDQLLEKKKVSFDQDKIVGFSLESNDENQFNIIVLYSVSVSGDMSQPEIALNPPDLQLVIREYAQQNGVTDTDPILFTIDDIANNLIAGPGYPIEEMVGGIPLKSIEKIGASILGLGLIASLGISGVQYMTTNSNIATNKTMQGQITAKKSATDSLIKENIHAFSRLTSVKPEQLTAYSELLWNNFSLVTTARADRETGVLRARVPVEVLEASGTGGNTMRLNNYSDIKNTLDRTFSEGLSRGKLTLSADNNAYEIEYNFKTLDNNLNSIVGRK